MPYSPAILADIDPSCSAGSAIWMSCTWLLYFGIREPHIPVWCCAVRLLAAGARQHFHHGEKEIEKLHKETRGSTGISSVVSKSHCHFGHQSIDYRRPCGFRGSANLVQNMRHITLDGLQRNPVDSWNHNAFLQLHDLTQQAMTVSKTSVWADSENPSQDFVPADPTQDGQESPVKKWQEDEKNEVDEVQIIKQKGFKVAEARKTDKMKSANNSCYQDTSHPLIGLVSMNNIISWNIRGLNSPLKHREVDNYLSINSVGVAGTLETRMNEEKVMEVMKRKWHMYEYVSNNEGQNKGSILTQGGRYTWSNKQVEDQRIVSKMDRALINEEWLNQNPEAYATILAAGISAHNSLVIRWGEEVKNKKRAFKFYNVWLHYPGCKAAVEKVWEKNINAIKQRSIRNKIRSFTNTQAELMKDYTKVETHFMDYYQELLGKKVWVYELIKRIVPQRKGVDYLIDETAPLAQRWECRYTYGDAPRSTTPPFRDQLTSLRVEDFRWQPYAQVLHRLPDSVHKAKPFGRPGVGCSVGLLGNPTSRAKFMSRYPSNNWVDHHSAVRRHWNRREEYVLRDLEEGDPGSAYEGYYERFMVNTVRLISNPKNYEPQGYETSSSRVKLYGEVLNNIRVSTEKFREKREDENLLDEELDKHLDDIINQTHAALTLGANDEMEVEDTQILVDEDPSLPSQPPPGKKTKPWSRDKIGGGRKRKVPISPRTS
ncbi:OLC1v1012054C1 [Oldenlandia corymbosa var. corymbosa]|uniref:OLC1v1012054C1 n=1 Tax=Oldenlandia corymbosa var. corymbosa TaxID=529605 RepID=A0AAV1DV44_OLDCO|nr:OLC1v1012054C1 [Oldenlandia corymbosa var. corymbosa]